MKRKDPKFEPGMKPIIIIGSVSVILTIAAFILMLVLTSCDGPKYGCKGNYHMSGYHPKNK